MAVFAMLSTLSLANAETCVTPSLDEKIKSADAIFAGRVIARRKDISDGEYASDHDSCGGKFAKLKVMASWKGRVLDEQDVYSDDACDGLGTYFFTGDDYLVFATYDALDKSLVTDIYGCYTEPLIESLTNQSIHVLNKKFQKNTVFSDADLSGFWQTYGNKADIFFDSDVDNGIAQFKFIDSAGLKMTFSEGEKVIEIDGGFYVKGGNVFIGFLYDGEHQSFQLDYQFVGDELVLNSMDESFTFLFHLKRK